MLRCKIQIKILKESTQNVKKNAVEMNYLGGYSA